MLLTLTCDSSGIGGFVLMISMKRFSGVLRKVMETPCMRIWGAMRRSSLESAVGDFGQRGEAATRIPAQVVSSASRSEAVRIQSPIEGTAAIRLEIGEHWDDIVSQTRGVVRPGFAGYSDVHLSDRISLR